jgi:hypothetical protein
VILRAVLGKEPRPRALRIVEHERDEAHLRLLARRIRRRERATFGLGHRARAHVVEQVAAEEKAQHQQDRGPADPHSHPAATESTTPAPVFDVRAASFVAPLHGGLVARV